MPLPELTPDYALRFDYHHHSNPMSQPRGRKLFDKVIVRPMLDKLWKEDPDRARQLDPNRAASPRMLAGTSTQKAVDSVLNIDDAEPMKLDEAHSWAKSEGLIFENRHFISDFLGNSDEQEIELYKEEIPLVINHALEGLKQAMSRENRYVGEIILQDKLPGCELPHNTRPDYARRGDLKTKWSSVKRKSYLPNNLSGPFEQKAVYQVAGFWALNGQQPPFLVYANYKDFKVFDQDNSPELSDENLARIVKEIARHHQVTEQLLKKADNQDDLFRMIDPEWHDGFAWTLQPELKELARRVFK